MPLPYMLPFVLGAPMLPMTERFDEALAGPDFGFDILTLPDLDTSFAPRRDQVMLADAFLRRLYTRRGLIWSDPSYGFYVLDYLNDELTPTMLAELVAGIEAQAELDERISGVDVRATFNPRTEKLNLRIGIASAAGPFTLVLGITSVTLDIFMLEA